MKLNLSFLIFFILVTFSSCQKIKYKSDFGFLNSAQANSPEYLAMINGKFCRDLDGQMGLCAKRIKSNEAITINLDKRPYPFHLTVTCSSLVNFSLSVDVLPETPYEFVIHPEMFSTVKSFTCVGEVFPKDRDQSVSAFWQVRFIVLDGAYQAREEINVQGELMVLGEHARYVNVDGRESSKKTAISAKGVKQVYTESEMMRFNYYGL